MNSGLIDSHIDMACNSGDQHTYAALFQSMKNNNVYLNLSENGEIELQENTNGTDSTVGIICYSSPSDKRLNDNYGEMVWEDALNLLIGFPQKILLILPSASGAWVGVSQDKAHTILLENADNSDLQNILKKAATTQEDEDYYNFFKSAYNRYIFFPVEEDENRSVKIANAQNGLKVIVFYLAPSDKHLCDTSFWQDGLKLIIANPGIDGLIIQSESEENIAINREKIEHLLKIYEEWNNHSEA